MLEKSPQMKHPTPLGGAKPRSGFGAAGQAPGRAQGSRMGSAGAGIIPGSSSPSFALPTAAA